MASGLVVIVPVLITLYAVRWLYGFIANLPLVDRIAPSLPVVGAIDPQLSQVLFTIGTFAGIVLGVGYLMRTAAGVVVADQIDSVINRIPVFRMVYNASQMAVETAVSGDIELRQPVKVFLWGDTRLTAFQTGKQAENGRQILFVPTAPNVTSGFVIEVDESDIHKTDESLEEALTRIISAGFGERETEPSEITTPAGLEEISQERRERDRTTIEDSADTENAESSERLGDTETGDGRNESDSRAVDLDAETDSDGTVSFGAYSRATAAPETDSNGIDGSDADPNETADSGSDPNETVGSDVDSNETTDLEIASETDSETGSNERP